MEQVLTVKAIVVGWILTKRYILLLFARPGKIERGVEFYYDTKILFDNTTCH